MSRVAIVGGGIGGLTAALLLTRQGIEVELYERSSRVGGRVAFEKRDRYRIDRGPTIVLLPEMLLGILEEGGISRDAVQLLRCDPLYRIHFGSGRTLTKVNGTARQVEEIRKSYPGEEKGFIRFMNEMGPLFPLGQSSFLERGFKNRRAFFSPGNLALMARLRAYRSMRSAVGSYFRSEELKDAYSLQSLYIGGAPFRTPGIYTMLPFAEHAFGVWMLKGGYAELPRILERELLARGARIHTNTEVESLVVGNGRCSGIRVNGESLAYDAVLYNGDFPHLGGLLPPDLRVRSRIRSSFKASSGCLLIYIGAARRWPSSLTHQFFLPESLDASLHELFERQAVPKAPSYYVFNPAALDDSAAPPGESVLYFLVPVPSGGGIDWESEAVKLADRVLEDAEQRGYPGLASCTVWRKIRTPRDAEREGMFGGGSFGIAPVLSQSGVFRPQTKPFAIQGLYAAGASVHPGGGVPIVMQGARLAVHQLIEEMNDHES